MAAAVIGVGALQYHWIGEAMAIKQEEYDSKAFSALNSIVERLEKAEEINANLAALDLDSSSVEPLSMKEELRLELETPSFNSTQSSKLVNNKIKHTVEFTSGKTNICNCETCRKKRLEEYERRLNYVNASLMSSMLNPAQLEERIELKSLNEYINAEFEKRGILGNFNYGIYSNLASGFVIADGHFLVSDDQSTAIENNWEGLLLSKYKVPLFPNDMKSPGMLMIQFPNQASLLYKSVFWPLVLSILFTLIIMGCFYYTITTIFHQKKLSEMKTDFINNMTHEFKTPIATISLAADSISSPKISGSPDKVKRFASIIRQENKRMNAQVEKVLQMAVIDKEEFQLHLVDINVNDVVTQAVGHANLKVEKKEGIVTAELLATEPTIQGDQTHISNIIHNLLDNANKYSPEKPRISVLTENIPNGVQVTISDQGIGMTKEARKHIFDKFYRVHTGDRHDVKGFGLGLSYVKALMTAHKGNIDVVSELGKGSSFILFFPYRVEN